MRLLYWTETYWPLIGGVQTYSRQFIRAIQELGYEVSVITVRLDDSAEFETVDGAAVHRLPIHDVLRGRDPAAFMSLRQKIAKIRQEFDPDIGHVNFYGPSIALYMEANKRAPIPTVIATHLDLTTSGGFGAIVGRAFDQAEWVTAVSRAALDDLVEAFPAIREKSSFIYNGLDTSDTRALPLPKGPPRILCFGRLVREKGFDTALEAFAKLRHSIPEAHLTIAGDGPERAALEQQAKKLGVEETVNFAGWIAPENIYDLIADSTVVVVPSRWQEVFGLTALEAALMARPVVASFTGGLKEVVVDGTTGFLVPIDDSTALADRLQDVLADRNLAEKFGAAARASALERFSIEVNAQSYDALYRRLESAEATVAADA